MKMEPVHKKPRKDAVRMGNRDFEKSIRAKRRRNFEMKKWIESYYDRQAVEK